MSDSNTSGLKGVSSVNGLGIEAPSSIQNVQLRFAALQLKQSLACRASANEYVEKLKNSQSDSNKCSEMLRDAYGTRTNNSDDTGKKGTVPSQELLDYCKKYSIKVPDTHDGGKWNYNEWDTAIKALTNYQESLTASSQTDMVYLQDFMGQYDSYIQGAARAGTDVGALLKNILTS